MSAAPTKRVMKVQQTLAQTWKRRRDSDHATAKRLIAERGVGLLAVSVLFAYGAWGVANAIGCVVAMEAVRSGAWTPVFVWFGAAAAWNACLFCRRPPLRRAKVA